MISAMDYRPPAFDPNAAPANPDAEIERLAHKRARAKLGWYMHAVVYVCVNALLVAISLLSGHGRWHWGPLLGWGMGLAIHGVSVFWLGRGSGLHERLVQREREQLQRQRRGH